MTHIADLLPTPWPQNVTDALTHWRQGDLIECPPFFYAADPRNPLLPFTASNSDPARTWQVLSLAAGDRPPFGAIVTQTCDISEARPLSPFVDVAPVIDLEGRIGNGEKSEIRRHLFNNYVLLTRQPAKDGFFVVDLRAYFPIEKGALVARSPIVGFANELDRLDFSDRVATRFSRPAYADAVQDHVIRPLDRWIRDGLKEASRLGSERFSGVEEVRLRIEGDRLDPKTVQLVVFQKKELNQEEQEAWRTWRIEAARLLMQALSIELRPIQFSSKRTMSASDYEELARVPLRYVGRDGKLDWLEQFWFHQNNG